LKVFFYKMFVYLQCSSLNSICEMLGDDYAQQNGSHVDEASPWLVNFSCIWITIVLNLISTFDYVITQTLWDLPCRSYRKIILSLS